MSTYSHIGNPCIICGFPLSVTGAMDSMILNKTLNLGINNESSKGKIVLVGAGGSGKDFLRRKMEQRGFVYAVPYTSRPKRDYEIEGKDYRFVGLQYFDDHKDDFYEILEYNKWKYGKLKKDFEDTNLFVMTPKGVSLLLPKDRERCFIIYINPDDEIRRKRLAERNDADTVDRRMKTDYEDFLNFTDYDMVVKNSDF